VEIAIAITGLIGIYLTHVWTKLYEQQKFRDQKLNETFKAVNRNIARQIKFGICTHMLFKHELTMELWDEMFPPDEWENAVMEYSDMLTDVSTYCRELEEPLKKYQNCMSDINELHLNNAKVVTAFDQNPNDTAAARVMDEVSEKIGKLLKLGDTINGEIKAVMRELQSGK